MTPEELKGLLDSIKTKQTEIQEAAKNKADRTELDALKTELADLKEQKRQAEIDAFSKKLDEQLDVILKQGEEITTLKEVRMKAAEGNGFKTQREAMVAAFDAKEVKDQIATMLSMGGKLSAPIRVEFKDAIVESVEATIGAGDTQYTITQNTNIISRIRKRELRYLATVSVGSIGTERALWIEELDEQGNPIFIGEGDAKTQLSVRYEERTQAVKKIAVYTKITSEFFQDLPQLVSYILNNLGRRLDIKTEDQLFAGPGTGDDLKGSFLYATAFAAPAQLANTIVNANELDVLEAIALQCKNAYGMPSGCFVTPSTMSAIRLIKDSTGRPVWKDYITTNGEFIISGMRIIETNALDGLAISGIDYDFLGGELEVINVLVRSEMAFQFGLDGNDFTQNKKTALLEKRLVQFVSANDSPVLIKGDFTTAKAALLASPVE